MFLVAFDLEGPLSTQDNAYEVMSLIPDGQRLFERISRYDDLLTLEGRPNYEPGDTLKLILPFLLAHGISEQHIRQVSEQGSLVSGAEECIQSIQSKGHQLCIISTSYSPHALSVAERLKIPADRVCSTTVNFDRLKAYVTTSVLDSVLSWQQKILHCPSDDDNSLRQILDEFFWKSLTDSPLGVVLDLNVVGGRRKTQALHRFTQEAQIPLNSCIVIGDSITDAHLLRSVRDEGGVAIVFNGNEYALPYGTVGVASSNLQAILPLLDAFLDKRIDGLKNYIQQTPSDEGSTHYHWLLGAEWQKVLPVHRYFRKVLRGQAAKLG